MINSSTAMRLLTSSVPLGQLLVGTRYSKSMGANVLGRKLMPLAPVGGRIGVMLPNANGLSAMIAASILSSRALISISSGEL